MRKLYVLSILGSLGISACSGEEGTSNPPPPPATTGGTATGGTATGGNATGGVSTGGTSTGGVATGGVATGGVGTGGSTGGAPVAGGGAGGKATGGAPAAGGGAGGAMGGGGAGGGGVGGTAAGGGGKGGGGAGGSVGGAAGGGSGGGATATFGAVADLMGKRCASDATQCHGSKQTFHPNFSNTDGMLRMRLLAAPSGNGVEQVCKSQTLVVPNMPEKSLLIAVLGADDGPRMGCAKRMPDGCSSGGGNPCLTDGEIGTIRSWIAAGALP